DFGGKRLLALLEIGPLQRATNFQSVDVTVLVPHRNRHVGPFVVLRTVAQLPWQNHQDVGRARTNPPVARAESMPASLDIRPRLQVAPLTRKAGTDHACRRQHPSRPSPHDRSCSGMPDRPGPRTAGMSAYPRALRADRALQPLLAPRDAP